MTVSTLCASKVLGELLVQLAKCLIIDLQYLTENVDVDDFHITIQ